MQHYGRYEPVLRLLLPTLQQEARVTACGTVPAGTLDRTQLSIVDKLVTAAHDAF